MIDNPAWYVVHAKNQQDRIAADALERRGFGVYLPMRQTLARHARSKQIVMRPLFGRYLFVGLDADRPAFSEVRRTVGVEWLLQTPGSISPMPIPASIVASIRAAEDAGAFDEVDRSGHPVTLPRAGDRVRVCDGPFAGMIAEVAAASSEHRIEIVIRASRAEIKATAALAKLERVG